MIYIILDINGTLLDRGDPSSASKIRAKYHVEPNVTVHSRPCYFRPFLTKFLASLFAGPCRVGVWTSLRPENTTPIVGSIFGPHVSNPSTFEARLDQEPLLEPDEEGLFMIWSQRKCILRDYGAGLDAHDWKASKPIMLKNLALLWSLSPEACDDDVTAETSIEPPLLSHGQTGFAVWMHQTRRLAVGPGSSVKWLDETTVAQHGLLPKPKHFPTRPAGHSQLTARNTLIIEDSPFKCGLQEENGLFIPSYHVQDEKTDTVLYDLMQYVKNLFEACHHDPHFDVRDYLKQHPFQCT